MTGAAALDEIIHAPNRLQICAFLASTDEAEFAALRDLLGVSDSVTSKQLKVLEQAGYVSIRKPVGRGRVRTWVRLTRQGRRAFNAHVAALRAIMAGQPTAPAAVVGSGREPAA